MQQYIYFFVFPLLAIFSGFFIITSIRSKRLEALHRDHEDAEQARHEHKEMCLSKIDGNLSMLNSRIDEKVLPAVEGLYQAVTRMRPLLSAADIKDQLISALGGEERVLIAAEDPPFLLFGKEFKELKVTFMAHYFPESNDLVFDSFAHKFPSASEALLKMIVSINSKIKIGCVYARDVAGTLIVFNKHAIHCPRETLSDSVVEDIVFSLAEVHYRMSRLLQDEGIEYTPMQIEEYIPLHNRSAELEAAKASKSLKEPEQSVPGYAAQGASSPEP